MANVRLSVGTFGADVPRVARFGDAEEILSRTYRVRIGIPAVELEVVRQSLRKVDDQAIVRGGARVHVGTDGSEPRIRPVSEEKEAGMQRIGQNRWEVRVRFSELSKPERPDVLDVHDGLIAELALEREIRVAYLRVAQVVRNWPDPTKSAGRREAGSQDCI